MSWLNNAAVTLPKPQDELLADAKSEKIREINEAYTAEAEPLVRDYPEIERQSWTEQNREAQAYLAWSKNQQGDPPDTPILDNILLGRNGEDGTEIMQELCEAVVNNAARFTQFQLLTGKRQRLVKKVKVEDDLEAIQSVEW